MLHAAPSGSQEDEDLILKVLQKNQAWSIEAGASAFLTL